MKAAIIFVITVYKIFNSFPIDSAEKLSADEVIL